MEAWRGDTWKLLQQVANELEDGRSCVLTHAINPEVAALAMAAETDLEQSVRLSPDRSVNGYPTLTGSALMADPQVARLDLIGRHGSPQDAL